MIWLQYILYLYIIMLLWHTLTGVKCMWCVCFQLFVRNNIFDSVRLSLRCGPGYDVHVAQDNVCSSPVGCLTFLIIALKYIKYIISRIWQTRDLSTFKPLGYCIGVHCTWLVKLNLFSAEMCHCMSGKVQVFLWVFFYWGLAVFSIIN